MSSNNIRYIKALKDGKLPSEKEVLSTRDRYNEYIMTSLRTMWGISLNRIRSEFGEMYESYLLEQAKQYLDEGMLHREGNILGATDKANVFDRRNCLPPIYA